MLSRTVQGHDFTETESQTPNLSHLVQEYDTKHQVLPLVLLSAALHNRIAAGRQFLDDPHSTKPGSLKDPKEASVPRMKEPRKPMFDQESWSVPPNLQRPLKFLEGFD